MKDTHFLYSIATLAIGSIITIFVSYATNTLPTHTPRNSIAAIATTPATKKCGCCTKMTPQDLKELKAFKQRNEKIRKQRQAYLKAAEFITQYGREEGLRRIRQIAPEVASQIEHFTEKYTTPAKH